MNPQARLDIIDTTRVRRRPGRTAALVGAGVLAGAVVAGLASAVAAPGPTPAPGGAPTGLAATAPSDPAARPERLGHPGRGLWGHWGRVLHGTAVVDKRDGSGTETLAVQRGELTAVTPTSVTVRSSDGFTATYLVDADTVVRVDRAPSTAAALASGQQVRVEGVVMGATTTARHIAQGVPPPAKRHGLGRHSKQRPSGGVDKRGATPTPSATPTR